MAELTKTRRLLKRSAILAPSTFTVGNMACGFFSLLAVSHQDYNQAAWLILTAIILDSLDGSVARLVHGESAFGVEFDSLADWVSFGIAPGYMMYNFALKDYGSVGKSIAFIYALCGALRLARFNVLAQSGQGLSGYFTGLPIPAGAGMLSSFILLYEIIEQGSKAKTIGPLMDLIPNLFVVIPVVMMVIAFLMVSNIPYKAFKQPKLLRPQSVKQVLLLAMGALLIYNYPQNAIFLFFCLYILSGFLLQFKRLMRKPQSSNAPIELPH